MQRAATIAGVVFLVVNLLLFLYPSSRFLPATRLGGVNVSGQNIRQATTTVDDYLSEARLRLMIDEQEQELSFWELGVRTNTQNIEDHLQQNRISFVPLLQLVYRLIKPQEFQPTIDEITLQNQLSLIRAAAAAVAESSFIQFDHATGDVIVTNPEGSALDVDAALNMLRSLSLDGPLVTLDLPTTPLEPKDRITNVGEARAIAERLVQTELILTLASEEITPPIDERIAWVSITYEDQQASVKLDEKMIEAYIKTLAETYDVPASSRTVKLQDGEQISGSSGSNGQRIDVGQVINDIVARLSGNSTVSDKPLTIATEVISPATNYDRDYTNTSKGLAAKIDYWASTHGGTYGVGVLELGGKNRSAYYNKHRQFVTASTYKLFVAYAVLQDVDNGKYSLSSLTDSNQTVRSALQDAIVNSGNETAISLAEKAGGWSAIDTRLLNDGFTATTINNYVSGSLFGDKKSTIADEVELLRRLYYGTLLSSSNTKLLLDWMKDQIWRDGVPTGVNGTVADKPGFLENYLHDAAIVYTPKTDFVLVILTENSSWANIADLAKLVEDHLST